MIFVLLYVLPHALLATTDLHRLEVLDVWSQHMTDFLPDDYISFNVDPKSMEEVVESIHKPTRIRGAYFTHSAKQEHMTFVIRSPSGQTLFKKQATEGVFVVNTTEIGDHTFYFDNRNGKQLKQVTFALDVVHATYDTITADDINPLENDIAEIQSYLTDIYYEHRFAQKRYETGHQSMRETNNRILWFTVAETAAIVCVTLWQVWYIKGLFSSRNLI